MKLENQCDHLGTGSLPFDNHAPQLRFFQIRNVQFLNKYTWLSQLRNLHICRHDGSIFTSVDGLYELLSRMHHLGSLYLEDAGCSSYIAPDRIPTHFPRLRCIGLRSAVVGSFLQDLHHSNLFSWRPLLNYIIPKFRRSIRLILELSPSGEFDSKILSRLARNYFQVNQPTYLDLATHTNYFTFSDIRDLGYQLRDGLIPETPFFDLVFAFFVGNSLSSTDRRIYQLFETLLFLSFPEAVELHLTVCPSHPAFFTDHQFGTFLSSFTALKKLVTVPETLYYLYTSPVISISFLFPLLDVLEIIVEEPLQGEVAPNIPLSQTLVPFPQLRKEAGVPISTFEYRCASGLILSNQKPMVDDLTSLDTFTGLKVVWDLKNIGTGQYIRGSVIPEDLDFVEKLRGARRLRELSDT